MDLHHKSGEAFNSHGGDCDEAEAIYGRLSAGGGSACFDERAQTADDLGIGHSTLDRWISERRGRTAAAAAAGETAEEELKRLRRENLVLREERDILKKATAFFARETRA